MKPSSHPFLLIFLAPLAADAADVKLPALFTDHMVLQRDLAVPVWGWTTPGQEVSVEFAGQRKTTRADSHGQWNLKLDPLAASAEPREMRIGDCVLQDVVVGEVWLCSGQSNMGMPVREAADAEREIAAATFDSIRLFSVAQNPSLEPVRDVQGKWAVCSPQSIAGFSAVAYFFGRELQHGVKVPVGLLQSSVGATRAEAWMRQEALRTVPTLAERADQERAQFQSQEEDNRKFVAQREVWEKKHGVSPPPVSEGARGWAEPSLDTSDWKPVTLPASWAELGTKSGGVFWVRKEILLPENAAGKPARLNLDWISEQYDTAFVNGVEVGRANDKPPGFYNVQRSYPVPAALLKPGRNVIAVRVVSATERARMGAIPNPLGLPPTHPSASDGRWLMKTESTFEPLAADALKSRPKPNLIPFRDVSASLYNGMIAPLIPYAIRGAIWYQGESNTPRASEYREVLSLMIGDWRAQWGQGDFPFILQQLVNNGAPAKDPNRVGNWPLLREAQMHVSKTLPHCGIAVGMDVGSALTIHPPNKQEVGKRLARVALQKAYGQTIESSGPRYDSIRIEGSAIRVKWTHAEGLAAQDGPPRHFAIAGADQRFVWADARMDGDTVVVSSPEVPQPVAVRYAWAANLDKACNLYNAAGLPAAPFRTDDWPLP